MGLNRDMKIQRPTGRKLLLLVPFALCYACFAGLGGKGAASRLFGGNVYQLYQAAA